MVRKYAHAFPIQLKLTAYHRDTGAPTSFCRHECIPSYPLLPRSKPVVIGGSAFAPLPSNRESALVIDLAILTLVTETPVRRRPPAACGPAAPWPSYLGDHTNVPPRPPNVNSSFLIEARTRQVVPDTCDNNWLLSMTFDAVKQAQRRPDRVRHPSWLAPISLDLLSHKALATVDAKYLASLRGNHELWTTKCRPMNAREVLGNETHAQRMKGGFWHWSYYSAPCT